MGSFSKINDQTLRGVNGGSGIFEGPWKSVKVERGYLALRSAPAYSDANEIGKLFNTQQVQIVGNESGNGYVWVWAPTLGKSGWVNQNNLV